MDADKHEAEVVVIPAPPQATIAIKREEGRLGQTSEGSAVDGEERDRPQPLVRGAVQVLPPSYRRG